MIKARSIVNTTFIITCQGSLDFVFPSGKSSEEVEEKSGSGNNEYIKEITVRGSLQPLTDLLDGFTNEVVLNTIEGSGTGSLKITRLTDNAICICLGKLTSSGLYYYTLLKRDEEISEFKELVQNQERIHKLFTGLKDINWDFLRG